MATSKRGTGERPGRSRKGEGGWWYAFTRHREKHREKKGREESSGRKERNVI